MQSPWESLANAVVLKAVEDYRNALNGKGYDKHTAAEVVHEVERFFRSHWFAILTKVNGEYLIEKLKKEHEETERSNHEDNISTSNP